LARKNIPIVMRDGTACGFMMTSGVMPPVNCSLPPTVTKRPCVKGRFSRGSSWPTVPFWPCIVESLLPTMTGREKDILILATTWLSMLVVSMTSTTRPLVA